MRSFLALLVILVAWTGSAMASDVVALAGERAARLGNYDFAIQAFEQAHAEAPNPELLDEIARADRARRALGQGRRPGRATWLAVMSPIMGAKARIDGGKAAKLPLFLKVQPGRRVIVVTAPGHDAKKRTLRVSRGRVAALDIALDPKPAKLSIETSSEAQVHVDGRFVGVAPIKEPLELEPGARVVSVTHTGYEPHEERITLERGKTRELEVDLERTDQRIAAALLLSGGSAGLAVSVTMGVLALFDHREARDLGAEHDDFPALIERRDDYRIVATVSGGIGLGLFLVGGALFILDEPAPPMAGDVSFDGQSLTVRF